MSTDQHTQQTDPTPEQLLLFECLTAALGGWVARYLCKLGFPEQVVRDATEVTWSKAAEIILNGRAGRMSSAARRTWLMRTARNAAATAVRSPWHRRRCPLPAAIPAGEEQSFGLTPAELEFIRAAVLSLPPDQQQAVHAVVFCGSSVRAAAMCLGWAQGTLRHRLGRAYAALRVSLAQMG